MSFSNHDDRDDEFCPDQGFGPLKEVAMSQKLKPVETMKLFVDPHGKMCSCNHMDVINQQSRAIQRIQEVESNLRRSLREQRREHKEELMQTEKVSDERWDENRQLKSELYDAMSDVFKYKGWAERNFNELNSARVEIGELKDTIHEFEKEQGWD